MILVFAEKEKNNPAQKTKKLTAIYIRDNFVMVFWGFLVSLLSSCRRDIKISDIPHLYFSFSFIISWASQTHNVIVLLTRFHVFMYSWWIYCRPSLHLAATWVLGSGKRRNIKAGKHAGFGRPNRLWLCQSTEPIGSHN